MAAVKLETASVPGFWFMDHPTGGHKRQCVVPQLFSWGRWATKQPHRISTHQNNKYNALEDGRAGLLASCIVNNQHLYPVLSCFFPVSSDGPTFTSPQNRNIKSICCSCDQGYLCLSPLSQVLHTQDWRRRGPRAYVQPELVHLGVFRETRATQVLAIGQRLSSCPRDMTSIRTTLLGPGTLPSAREVSTGTRARARIGIRSSRGDRRDIGIGKGPTSWSAPRHTPCISRYLQVVASIGESLEFCLRRLAVVQAEHVTGLRMG